SIGASLIYTARGAATAAFIPKAYAWDLAAGALILQQAGGELRYLSGRGVDLEELLDGRLTPEPILAGERGVVEGLVGKISLRDY
ncbi:MAG: inositol monophosphatase, partial [Anaerolineae bacterium]|nr:inositol monophosphatase [Anaerolineae bacterium]